MTTKISQRELNAISAYLDGELSARDRARLEAQLHKSPNLQAALKDLRRTRTLIRGLPEVRAPRNFTLTPAMVGVRPRAPGLFPALRLASAFATILLVLVVTGDFLGAFPSPGAEPTLFQEPPAAAVEEVVPEAELMLEAPAAELEVAAEAAEAESFSAEEPMDEAGAPAAQEPMRTLAEPEGTAVGQLAPLEKGVDQEDEFFAGTQPAVSADGGERLEAAPAQDLASEAASEPEAPAGLRAFLPALPTVRLVEALLAGIAITTGVLALIIRRRSV